MSPVTTQISSTTLIQVQDTQSSLLVNVMAGQPEHGAGTPMNGLNKGFLTIVDHSFSFNEALLRLYCLWGVG